MKRALYEIDFEDDKYGQYIKLSDGTMGYRVELPTIIMPPDTSEEDINIALFKQKINYINHIFIYCESKCIIINKIINKT